MSEAYSNPNFEETAGQPDRALEAAKDPMRPRRVMDIIQYFEKKELEDPQFAGYTKCAESLRSGLAQVIHTPEDDESISMAALLLKPGQEFPSHRVLTDMSQEEALYYSKRAESAFIYDGQETPATSALMFLGYRLTDAEPLYDSYDEDNNRRSVVMHGRYRSRHVYFLEEYGRDDLGDYMSWQVMSGVPDDLVPSPPERPLKPALTTGERLELWDGIFDLEKLREEDVVAVIGLEKTIQQRRAA